jgi:putative flippase GtrA
MRQWRVLAIIRRLKADERARFIAVGMVNTVVAYALFLAFEAMLGGRYLVSLLLAYLLATMLAFALHRRITFRVRARGGMVLDFVRFESVYVVMFVVNAAALALLVDVVEWPSWLAQAVTTVAITIMSYLSHKFFSFRGRQGASSRS